MMMKSLPWDLEGCAAVFRKPGAITAACQLFIYYLCYADNLFLNCLYFRHWILYRLPLPTMGVSVMISSQQPCCPHCPSPARWRCPWPQPRGWRSWPLVTGSVRVLEILVIIWVIFSVSKFGFGSHLLEVLEQLAQTSILMWVLVSPR